MKKIRNRILSIVLTCAMMVSLCIGISPMEVYAEEVLEPTEEELNCIITTVDVTLEVGEQYIQCSQLPEPTNSNYKWAYFYYPVPSDDEGYEEGVLELMSSTKEIIGVKTMSDCKAAHREEYGLLVKEIPSNGQITVSEGGYGLLYVIQIYDYPIDISDSGHRYYYNKVAIFDVSKGGTVSNGLVGEETNQISINKQPEDATVNKGEQATFTVEATGNDLKYSWQVNYGSGRGFETAYGYGSDTATFKTYSAEKDNNGYKYRCIITDGSGNSVTSDEATLTVISPAPPKNITDSVSITKIGDKYKVTGLGEPGEGYKWGYHVSDLGEDEDIDEEIESMIAEHLEYGPWETEIANEFDESYVIDSFTYPGREPISLDNFDIIEIVKLDENSMICEVAILPLPKSAAPSGDTYIEEVTVKVDWNKVPTLEAGMSNMPEFDGNPATVEGKGVYGQEGYGWAIQVDDSFKTSDKNYNDGIDRYKKNYGGWAPLDFVFENDSTYRINEEDTYALWVYVGKDEGYTFGEYGSGAYKGAVNSNVDFVGGFPDDIGMVAFFKLGTLAEMEEEKGTEKPSVHTHSLTIVPEKAATCTEAGNKVYYTCSGCDDLFADAKGTTTTTAEAVKIAALGHDWTGEWTIIKEATATEEGKKETLCERDCGQKKVAIIPVTGTKDDNGNLEKDAEVEPEAPIDEVTLNNSKKELLEAGNIFKDAEKAQIENGADARVWLEISKTDESDIASTDKGKIEQEANKIMGDKSIITYFDADLFKQIGTYEKTPVPEPGIAIKITVKIPDKLLNSDKTVSREYKIIRLHKGQVDVINGTFDAKTGEFTFESDKFSTYAIVYKDVPVNDNTNPTPGDTDVIKPETPDTGDSNAVQYSFMLMLLSGLGMIICSSKKKILNKES